MERETVGHLSRRAKGFVRVEQRVGNPLGRRCLGMHSLIWGGRGAVTALRLLRPTINGLRFTTGSALL